MTALRKPKSAWWQGFDFAAADARVKALATEMAAWPTSPVPLGTEAERDQAAQGSNYNINGWGKL